LFARRANEAYTRRVKGSQLVFIMVGGALALVLIFQALNQFT